VSDMVLVSLTREEAESLMFGAEDRAALSGRGKINTAFGADPSVLEEQIARAIGMEQGYRAGELDKAFADQGPGWTRSRAVADDLTETARAVLASIGEGQRENG